MKTSAFFLGLALLLPVAANAQDDVYYIPSKDIRNVTTADGDIVTTQVSSDKALYYEENRNVDDYNRRGNLAADTTAYLYDNDVTKSVESNFDDSSSSDVAYPYTKLVMRFHSPHPGYIVSSPFYWDICYGDVWDVYYDGWAAYVPSYTYWSYAYDPWYYNRWHFRTCWDFTWGWHSPWYSYSYWGWGRPIYWGWSRPVHYYHSRYHYSRPMWGHRGFDRYAPGFGHHGGRTFAGRGFDAPRGNFGGRAGGPGVGAPRSGSRPLSGIFRSDRTPASVAHNNGRAARNSGQMSRGTRQTGPNSVMRSDAPGTRNVGGGISRGGRVQSQSGLPSQRRVQAPSGSSRPSSVGSQQRQSSPSYGGSSRSSVPSSVGRSSTPRSSAPSRSSSGGGSFGRSSSPSHSGGGGVSRGGVSRGGRR